MSETTTALDFPKVLIIGQPFHNKSGGGITISNLFEQFPKSNIALATNSKNAARNNYSYCNNVYRLGSNEYKIRFPFGFIFKNKKSGVVTASDISATDANQVISKKKWYYNTLESLFFKLGIHLFAIRIKSSTEFEQWIKQFNPDIIYTQLGSIELLLFMQDLVRKTPIPLAIHMMDDWPSSMGQGPLKTYWKQLIHKKLKKLINYSSVNIGISEGMAIEYTARYEKPFHFFHNPIDLSKWITKDDISASAKNEFKILYTGRVSGEHYKSLEDLCIAINNLNDKSKKVSIDVYTPDWDTFLVKQLSSYNNASFFPTTDHKNIPSLLVKYDMLFLPLEFSENSIVFTKFSMPTKSSEYLISGVPILVYVPHQSEVFRHFKKHNLGYALGERNIDKLKEALLKMMNDDNYRNEISKNAVAYARANYNADTVRKKFLATLKIN